jgi:Uma2 family endonuclease
VGTGGLTYADYCALPDDGLRYEIIEGNLVAEPSPRLRRLSHQRFLGNLFAALRLHVKEHRAGEVFLAPFDVILDDRSVVVPDIVFVSRERLSIVAERGVDGADPEARVLEAFELVAGRYQVVASAGGDETFTPSLFPGLTLVLADLWE